MPRRLTGLFAIVGAAVAAIAATSFALAAPPAPPANTLASEVAALKAQVARLQQRHSAPELGQQMLELQIRHDRLWWAGQSGNWTLAYFMVGELGEALRGIVRSNGDAPEMQPEKLSEVMPSIMNPAIKDVQDALARQDQTAFAQAYDRLSAACTACHQVAGNTFLIMQRPSTPLLDNLRYAPVAR
ncbi:MAG TPA: hypothetical protein VGN24_01050 [Rhodanobacter sp.]|jgi:hypothetical protein|nr:hypothetical protein [Rhodanobacter sp.]